MAERVGFYLAFYAKLLKSWQMFLPSWIEQVHGDGYYLLLVPQSLGRAR